MSARLRVFAGEFETVLRPEEYSLRDAFCEFLLPQLERARRSASHISRFSTALGHWERITPDPPVVEIDDACFQHFADRLLAWHHKRGLRGNENTLKTLGYISAILRACCKRGHSNKRGQTDGRHLIEDLPVAVPPDGDRQKKRTAHVDEVSAAYDACEIAKWPNLPCGSPAAWKMLWVMDYCYGPRTEDLLKLRWESIHWDGECPAEDVSRLAWSHGWLVYTPSKTRRFKPQPLHLPLLEVVRKHLEIFRPCRQPTGPIFGFPRNMRDLHDTRKRIWQDAGVPVPYTFQEVRKTCSTAWNDLYPNLGEHVTGHAPRGVNAKHYDAELRRLCRFAPQLPIPEAFFRGVGLEPMRPSARAELAERLGAFSEETAKLILSLADSIAG